jgi:hypothetical protein
VVRICCVTGNLDGTGAGVSVRRHLTDRERLSFRSRLFPQSACAQAGAIPRVHGKPASEIRKLERSAPVSAVGRTQEREKSGMLADLKQLAITQGPAARRKISTEHDDFCNKRI